MSDEYRVLELLDHRFSHSLTTLFTQDSGLETQD